MGTVSGRIRMKVERAGFRVVEAGWAEALHHQNSGAERARRAAESWAGELQTRITELEVERDQWRARYDAAIKASAEEN